METSSHTLLIFFTSWELLVTVISISSLLSSFVSLVDLKGVTHDQLETDGMDEAVMKQDKQVCRSALTSCSDSDSSCDSLPPDSQSWLWTNHLVLPRWYVWYFGNDTMLWHCCYRCFRKIPWYKYKNLSTLQKSGWYWELCVLPLFLT